MGYGYIAGFLETGLNFEKALEIHCRFNLFPPIDVMFIPSFLEAIDLVNCGDLRGEVELPTGLKMKAGDIIMEAHLEAFIEVVE